MATLFWTVIEHYKKMRGGFSRKKARGCPRAIASRVSLRETPRLGNTAGSSPPRLAGVPTRKGSQILRICFWSLLRKLHAWYTTKPSQSPVSGAAGNAPKFSKIFVMVNCCVLELASLLSGESPV
jgi:hypothetical protein